MKLLISNEEKINRIEAKNPTTKVIEIFYVDDKETRGNRKICKCKYVCRVHGYEWTAFYSNLIKGRGCIICKNEKLRKERSFTLDYVKQELNKIRKDIIIIDNKYINSNTKLLCKCLSCNNVWGITWDNLKGGYGCPICKKSKGELRIHNFLESIGVEHECQVKYEGLLGVRDKPLSYDFYLPRYNLLIEYQGEYHDGTARNQTKEEYIRQVEHDRRKKNYAKENNIDLLEIWYWDYENIENILSQVIEECEYKIKLNNK